MPQYRSCIATRECKQPVLCLSQFFFFFFYIRVCLYLTFPLYNLNPDHPNLQLLSVCAARNTGTHWRRSSCGSEMQRKDHKPTISQSCLSVSPVCLSVLFVCALQPVCASDQIPLDINLSNYYCFK